MSKLKATSVAFAGQADDYGFDALDPEGLLITNTFLGTGENLIGEKAHVKVMQGSERQKQPGTFWAEYAWTPYTNA